MVTECPACHLGQGHSVPYAAFGRDRLPWCKRSTGPVPYMPHFRHGHRQSVYHFYHLNQIHFEFDLNVDDVSFKSVRVASTLPGPHDYRSVWRLSRLLIMWELVACAKSVRNVTSRRSHIHMSERCIGSPVPYEATVQPARGTYPVQGDIWNRCARLALPLPSHKGRLRPFFFPPLRSFFFRPLPFFTIR